MKTTIAVLGKKGQDAYLPVVRVLEQLQTEDACFVVASPSAFLRTKKTRELQEKHTHSPVVFGSVLSRNRKRQSVQVTRLPDAVCGFEGQLYGSLDACSALLQKAKSPKQEPLENLIRNAEGDFSLIVVERERILAARDALGVQPLYYGENVDFAALASNRKALWKLGINEAYSFPPGNLAAVSHEGFKFTPVRTLANSNPRQTTMNEAAQTLRKMLEHSVRIRLQGVKEVAVAFSGGLDSCVVAFMAKKCCANVRLVHVSLCGQSETEEARKAADELNLPLSVYLFESEDVEKIAAKVVELIEEPDPVKAAVGIPFYWVAEKTAEFGLDVLLAGQGADELFGGYQRYVNDYLSRGAARVRETMFADVTRLHEANIERDKKICGFHDVELRLPFASFELAEFALSLPMELKIEKQPNGQRKIVLRRLAQDLGLTESIVNKPKHAVQYATGVNDALGRIAKKHGMTVRAYVTRLFLEGKC